MTGKLPNVQCLQRLQRLHLQRPSASSASSAPSAQTPPPPLTPLSSAPSAPSSLDSPHTSSTPSAPTPPQRLQSFQPPTPPTPPAPLAPPAAASARVVVRLQLHALRHAQKGLEPNVAVLRLFGWRRVSVSTRFFFLFTKAWNQISSKCPSYGGGPPPTKRIATKTSKLRSCSADRPS